MSETRMWEHLRDKWADLVHAERITEKLNDGVPDVTYQIKDADVAGWIELKRVEKLTWKVTRIPWKTPAQPLWLTRWARNGGSSYVLLRVEEWDNWYLFQADGTVEWNKMIQQPLLDRSQANWLSLGKLDVESLVRYLRQDIVT